MDKEAPPRGGDSEPLRRFVDAQQGVYDIAIAELRAGRKRSHWMWFVFPQLTGLGRSAMSQRYALADLSEARAYLNHALLGPRLLACARVLISHAEKDPVVVLGAVDVIKLRSSLTLFALADPSEPLFQELIDVWFGGEMDPLTVRGTKPST